ncbi:SGNH/GDSL hydrolase family protein [Siphonobacter sp. SORGH_AS_0500]|uniref:SGNH/GDSL hydrolase family protein n=1 Tax=Siphonobacter sp. SORGH_AS_0500 TaxID=1864824 RepID=UPI00286198F5|nr:SGNH/GDSL hydrolase family protein [Siphonobacter sp. SORGH_AS_0500]MDR6197437.1 lysophospholipase L1-like esterase [Siphonobacter sp. SORGH_AS_0500]
MHKISLVLLLFFNLAVQAQSKISWWNPASHSFPVIEGQGWSKGLQKFYDRLPASAEKEVRPPVWDLSRQSAGMFIRFISNATQITVRYTVGKKQPGLPHMPATGVSGVDLYARDPHGAFAWCGGKYTFGDTITYQFSNLKSVAKGQEFRLYLPLYNSVEWLEIGVPEQEKLTPLALREEKPVVVYGTSIAQGACASRPGMAWTSILERQLDHPLINLGFSGNGRLEKEVLHYVNEIDARLFVLDCLPNLVASVGIAPEEIRKRIVESVKVLKQKHPQVPVLVVEHAGYSDAGMNPLRNEYVVQVNAILQEAYQELKASFPEGLYLLSKSEINLSNDAMVDGTHPSDLGMQAYADAYQRKIRMIWNEPQGSISTTRPIPQSRDFYNYETRHRAILKRLKQKKPPIVFLGNSITHFWGGEPLSERSNGPKTWIKYMEPLGVQNLGFGWDRIENVLWRVYHGELDGYKPHTVAVMIGTNNLEWNTNEEIVEGLRFLIQAIRRKQPKARTILIGILPRRNQESRLEELNLQLAKAAGDEQVLFTQPGKALLLANGKIDETLFTDGLHPNETGYERMAEKLVPLLNVK